MIDPLENVLVPRNRASPWGADLDAHAAGLAIFAQEHGLDFPLLLGTMGAVVGLTKATWQMEGHEIGEIDIRLAWWWSKVLHHCPAILAAALLPAQGEV